VHFEVQFFVLSVMEVFVHTEEYIKAHDFTNVKPCDNKAKIIHCLKVNLLTVFY